MMSETSFLFARGQYFWGDFFAAFMVKALYTKINFCKQGGPPGRRYAVYSAAATRHRGVLIQTLFSD